MNKHLRLDGVLTGLLAHAATSAEVDHSVSRSVVQIRGIAPEGKLFFGSGVVIAPDSVATNCHVVRGGGRIGVFRGVQSFRVTQVRADTQHDACILQAQGITAPKARLGQASRLQAGQSLAYYGYPRALGMAYSAGAVKSLHLFGDSRIIETSAFFTLGGSGGGLFNQQGELVGLATFLAPGHGGAYFAIPAEWIATARAHEARPVGVLPGLSFWEEPVHLPAFLKEPGP